MGRSGKNYILSFKHTILRQSTPTQTFTAGDLSADVPYMNISIIITVLALNNLSLIYTAGGIKVPLMHTKIFHFEMV